MPRRRQPSKKLEFFLHEDDAALLDKIAERQYAPMGELIRRAIYQAIPELAENYEKRTGIPYSRSWTKRDDPRVHIR